MKTRSKKPKTPLVRQTHNSLSNQVSSFFNTIGTEYAETIRTFSHLGVLLAVFIVIVIMFMWKEGKIGFQQVKEDVSNKEQTTPPVMAEIPSAEVGIRMLLDKAQGEMGVSSREAVLTGKVSSDSAIQESLPDIDLKGPWVCQAATAQGMVEIYVKDKQILSRSTDQEGLHNSLISGDCAYDWIGSTGVKECGLGEYLNIAEMLISSGMMDIETILQSQSSQGSNNADVLSVLRSCRKQPIVDSIFVLPQGVVWTESDTTSSDAGIDKSSIMNLFDGM